MGPLDLVQLTALMDRTSGRREISIGLIDGPVALIVPSEQPERNPDRALGGITVQPYLEMPRYQESSVA